MSEPLSLEVEAVVSGTHVRVTGEIDLDTRNHLPDTLAALGVQPRHVSLDLRGVTFLDSSGLNMLLELHDQCAANGGTLRLLDPPEHLSQLLTIAGLDEHLRVARS